ncbi:MAG: response regulator [Anaerolineae bacterium]|nr:response regulator [Anaerolineae bacterium]
MRDELILVVDDHQAMRSLMSDILIPEGYTVIQAINGLDALEKIQLHSFDLIITDLQMDKMDGEALIIHLNEEGSQLPIIVMTGHGSESVATRLFRMGVRDYLIKGEKGVNPVEVLEAVDRSLRERRVTRERDDLAREITRANVGNNRRFQELKALYKVGRIIANLPVPDLENDLAKVFVYTLTAAHRLIGSHESAIYLAEGHQLVCYCLQNVGEDRPHPVRYVVDDPLAHHVMETREALKTSQDGQGGPSPFPLAGAMAAPIRRANQALGAIVIRQFGGTPRQFDDHELEYLSGLADYLAMAVESSLRGRAKAAPAPAQIAPKAPASVAIPTPPVFISYSRQDGMKYAQTLVTQLRQSNFNIWFDQDSLEAGKNWLNEVNTALHECAAMVLCVTPDALQSFYVQIEYQYFIDERKPIVPLICMPIQRLPAQLRVFQHVPFDNTESIIRQLNRILNMGRPDRA